MAYTLPKLPYAYDALEPYMDAATVEIHYSKHHQTYVNNLNALVEGTEYAAGDDGLVEVPVGYVQHLAQFGFTNPPAEPAADAPVSAKASRGKKTAPESALAAAEPAADAPAADAQA